MMTAAQFVDRVLGQLQGAPDTLIDDIYRVQTDALLALGESVAVSPVRHILTRDFQVSLVAGSGDLNGATLVGGGSLDSANVLSICMDTIKWGKALHPDSQDPIQWITGGTQNVDKPQAFMTRVYLWGTISTNSLYLRWDDGSVPSDGLVIFKGSYAPTIDFFSVASADYTKLEADLVSLAIKLVSGQPAQSQ